MQQPQTGSCFTAAAGASTPSPRLTLQNSCLEKKNTTQSSLEGKPICHQDYKPAPVQMNCTVCCQVEEGTNSPTQLSLAHPLRLLLWVMASKQGWHSSISTLQLTPRKVGFSATSRVHWPVQTPDPNTSRFFKLGGEDFGLRRCYLPSLLLVGLFSPPFSTFPQGKGPLCCRACKHWQARLDKKPVQQWRAQTCMAGGVNL